MARPILGDMITLEYNAPAHVTEKPVLSISTFVHGYRNIYSIDDFSGSGSCNVNVKCELGADWQDQIRGVAMILTGGGSR